MKMTDKMTINFKQIILILGIVFLCLYQFTTYSSASADTPKKLIYSENLEHIGAFRVPQSNLGGDSKQPGSIAFGGSCIAYNSKNDSLFMFGHGREKLLLELKIPKLKKTNKINELKFAKCITPPTQIMPQENWNMLTERGSEIGNGGAPSGLLIYDKYIVGSAFAYYDAMYEGARSHFIIKRDFINREMGFTEFHKVGVNPVKQNMPNGGFVGGYMAKVPVAWQEILGGSALTGQCCIPIIHRTSFGPSIWSFDPMKIGYDDPVPAKMLIGYPEGHAKLGGYGDEPSLYFNKSTEINGVVFPVDTDSILFFGRHGLGITGKGDSCYGIGTNDRSLHQQKNNEGINYCYDESSIYKGTHGYPYIYQVWAYDSNELKKVISNEKKPWDVLPYAVFELKLPFKTKEAKIIGAAYDEKRNRIYISQANADIPGYEPFPIIHCYEINMRN